MSMRWVIMGLNFTVILLLNLLSVPSLFVLSCKTYKMKKAFSHNLHFYIKRKLGGIEHSFLQLIKRRNASPLSVTNLEMLKTVYMENWDFCDYNCWSYTSISIWRNVKKNSKDTKDGNHQNLPCFLMTLVLFCGGDCYGRVQGGDDGTHPICLLFLYSMMRAKDLTWAIRKHQKQENWRKDQKNKSTDGLLALGSLGKMMKVGRNCHEFRNWCPWWFHK